MGSSNVNGLVPRPRLQVTSQASSVIRPELGLKINAKEPREYNQDKNSGEELRHNKGGRPAMDGGKCLRRTDEFYWWSEKETERKTWHICLISEDTSVVVISSRVTACNWESTSKAPASCRNYAVFVKFSPPPPKKKMKRYINTRNLSEENISSFSCKIHCELDETSKRGFPPYARNATQRFTQVTKRTQHVANDTAEICHVI